MAYPDTFANDSFLNLTVMTTKAILVFYLTGYWILVGTKQPRGEVLTYFEFQGKEREIAGFLMAS